MLRDHGGTIAIVRLTFLAVVGLAFFGVSTLTVTESAFAQGVPGIDANKCLSGKSKCISKKIKGLLKCREKCQKSATKCGLAQTFCEDKAHRKFDGGTSPEKGCFAKLEAKANPGNPPSVCTTTGDTVAVGAQVDNTVADLLASLEGTGSPFACGNGVIEGSEECEFGDLNGETCETQGLYDNVVASTGLACTPGTCQFDTSGCYPSRYNVDPPHGSRTVIDNTTGLQWEKKNTAVSSDVYCNLSTDCPNPRDVNNRYSWAAAGTAPNGMVFTNFLGRLNGAYGVFDASYANGCFAGHCDWRVPTIEALETIVDLTAPGCESGGLCIDPIFGPTISPPSVYWSSTTDDSLLTNAWTVRFHDASREGAGKNAQGYARAVRGGS